MTAPRRSTRSKTTVKNYYEVQGYLEEDEDLTPVRSNKRRRRVIPDSDDESEQDGDKMVQPRNVRSAARLPERTSNTNEVAAGMNDRAKQASGFPDSPLPTPPDASAEGRAEVDPDELDAYYADSSDEDVEDDEDEEEFIPGPDADDEDDVVNDSLSFANDVRPPAPHPPQEPEADVVNKRFEQILRKCLEELVAWVKRQDYETWRALDRTERAMALGAWRILSRVDVDFLMNLFLAAFSLQVQSLVAEPIWTLEDILALPDTFGDQRQGIYGNFPTGGGALPHVGCEAYVGSATNLHKRTFSDPRSHSNTARRYSVETLPDRHSGSLHYTYICRPGVTNNFRALCGFQEQVQRGYLNLLESVSMTIFGTYNDLGRYHHWASKASYDLSSQIRSSLGLPVVLWKGLNAAWPLYQGVPAPSLKEISPCANEHCVNMTYPFDKRPEGHAKRERRPLDPGNPLGDYVCPQCGQFRDDHGTLPDEVTCRKLEQNRQAKRLKAELIARTGTLLCQECNKDQADSKLEVRKPETRSAWMFAATVATDTVPNSRPESKKPRTALRNILL
ncbi:unnamed protein product [Alternaria alternata]